jgi:hypothetical protein
MFSGRPSSRSFHAKAGLTRTPPNISAALRTESAIRNRCILLASTVADQSATTLFDEPSFGRLRNLIVRPS